MSEIGVLLAIAIAVSVMVGFLVGVATEGRSRKAETTETPLLEEAIRLVAQEQFRAGERVGRAESMRGRVGQASEAVGRQPHQVAVEQMRQAREAG